MNLLMISGDRSLLSGKRGAFWYTLEELSRHFERIDIITPRSSDAAIDAKNPDALTFFGNVHLHPSPKGLLFQPRWIATRGAQLISLFHHSVMTVHDYPPFYNGIGARAVLRRHAIGSVAEIHHIVGYPTAASATERIGRFLSRLYLPFSLKRFTAVRVVNKGTAEILASWRVDRRKLAVVPSVYLDHQLFTSIDAVNTSKHFDLGFCGRLAPNKGLDSLLRAVAKVPHATLLVVGDGPERAASEKLAQQLDISERVEFRGWLSTQEDVLRAIATAKIFVMNSLSEGNPRIAIEAMAAGLPIVATKVGIMPDVIIEGKNGSFTTGEPEDLAAKIADLLSKPDLLRTMGTEAKAVRERFERVSLIAKYAEFLQSCAR